MFLSFPLGFNQSYCGREGKGPRGSHQDPRHGGGQVPPGDGGETEGHHLHSPLAIDSQQPPAIDSQQPPAVDS